MSEHKITLKWFKGDVPFTYDTYTRNHTVTFKDSAPQVFSASPTYLGDPSKADPEDLLVAALSSCHMLSFLAICARKRITVEAYDDDATLLEIHHLAHEACFIASSVKTQVTVEPR